MNETPHSSAAMAAPSAKPSPMLTGVDTLIDLLEREASELARKGPVERAGATRGVPTAGALSEQMEELDEFVHQPLADSRLAAARPAPAARGG